MFSFCFLVKDYDRSTSTNYRREWQDRAFSKADNTFKMNMREKARIPIVKPRRAIFIVSALTVC